MNGKTQRLILTGMFAALTAAGAFFKIPLGVLSLTLQTFMTALAGVLLGRKWGATSQLVYVLLGLVGIPVFTQGGGLGYLVQPSMGFLFGLIPAAWVIGALTEQKFSRGRLVLACVAGMAVLYLIGVPYMYAVLNLYMGKGMGLWAVLWSGAVVYLPGEALKIAAVALLAPPVRNALERQSWQRRS